jgi:hypothetical protein
MVYILLDIFMKKLFFIYLLSLSASTFCYAVREESTEESTQSEAFENEQSDNMSQTSTEEDAQSETASFSEKEKIGKLSQLFEKIIGEFDEYFKFDRNSSPIFEAFKNNKFSNKLAIEPL